MGPHSQGTIATDSKHSHSIELELDDLNQLFNSMDPSPFKDKDLDHDAEEFIFSWAQEYPPKQTLTLRVYLEQWPPRIPRNSSGRLCTTTSLTAPSLMTWSSPD